MSAYAAMFGARFRVLLQYRTAALAGLVTQIFFGAVLVAVMQAFYASADAPPMNLAAATSYLWLSQAFFTLVPWRGDPELTELVRKGDIAYELLRPVTIYRLWFARAVALRTAPVLLRAVPLLAVAWAALGLSPPASVTAVAGWLLALAGAVALSAVITVLLSIALLWTVSGEGLSLLLPVVVNIASGLLVPLPLMPAWLQPFLNWLPFRGLLDVPHRIYLGHLAGRAAGQALLLQWGWVAVLAFVGHVLLKRGLRRLDVQGG